MDYKHHDKALITLDEVTTGYGHGDASCAVTRGVNAAIMPGHVIMVLGPNGAGKSTMLRTILGYQPALSGAVRYGTLDVHQIPVSQRSLRVSAVLTDRISDRYLTVWDVVSTGRYPHGSFTGRMSTADKVIIEDALENIGIMSLVSRRFNTLSDGEKQKTMLARALAQQTPVICLDEPTAFIDSPGKVMMMSLITDMARQHHKAILMTTHDVEAALTHGDILWLMHASGTMEEGSPQELIDGGRINALFDQDDVIFDPELRRFIMKKK